MNVFLCGPDEVGIGPTCWWCDGPIPRHVSDKRFCSHDCAGEHASNIGDGPCTVCGTAKGMHPIGGSDPHSYFPFGADPDEIYADVLARGGTL